MSETKREYAANYRKSPLHTRFKPRGRPKKTLPPFLLAALNEPVSVTIDGKRRKITKREVIVTQMVNNAAGADLRATKMLIDMMKDIEQKAGVAAPPEPSLRPGRRAGDRAHGRADTGSPAARNPEYERGEPGSRDDLTASGVPR
jgi:hypothetical protein